MLLLRFILSFFLSFVTFKNLRKFHFIFRILLSLTLRLFASNFQMLESQLGTRVSVSQSKVFLAQFSSVSLFLSKFSLLFALLYLFFSISFSSFSVFVLTSIFNGVPYILDIFSIPCHCYTLLCFISLYLSFSSFTFSSFNSSLSQASICVQQNVLSICFRFSTNEYL